MCGWSGQIRARERWGNIQRLVAHGGDDLELGGLAFVDVFESLEEQSSATVCVLCWKSVEDEPCLRKHHGPIDSR